MTRPLVSAITPTRDRADKHAAPLYASFAASTYEPRELLVLDDSDTPSPFFTRLRDPRVRYWHSPKKITIGAARNWLIERARGEVIAHVDDDDEYAPEYVERMAASLDGFDVARLGVWRMVRESDKSFWRWDTQACGGMQYVISGDGTTVGPAYAPPDARFCEIQSRGWGFSNVYRREWAERVKFADTGGSGTMGEDHDWLSRCMALGARVNVVRDGESWVTHTVHDRSHCILYPQQFLGYARVGAGSRRMPPVDIELRPGARYAGTAVVKASNKTETVKARLSQYGLEIEGWSEDEPERGYRTVRFRLLATPRASGRFPTSLPAPLSWIDKSRVVEVGEGAASLWTVEVVGFAGYMGGAVYHAPPSNAACPSCRDFAFPSGQSLVVGPNGSWHHPSCVTLGERAEHRCTSCSAQTIASQLGPWRYAGSLPPKTVLPEAGVHRCGTECWTKHEATVTVPGGERKTVPYWTRFESLALRCPFTGEVFRFSPDTGAGRLQAEMARLYEAEARDASANGHASEAGRLRGAAARVDADAFRTHVLAALSELQRYAASLSPSERAASGIAAHLAHAEEATAGGDFVRAKSHLEAAAGAMGSVGAGSVGFGSWLDDVIGDISDVGNAFQIAGINLQVLGFQSVANLVQGRKVASMDELGAATCHDYANAKASGRAANLVGGDTEQARSYRKLYNTVTDNGKYDPFSGCSDPPPRPGPDPAGFDAASVLAAAQNGDRDARDAAQDLYDHGYYGEGDAATNAWLGQLAQSPAVIGIKTGMAFTSNNPPAMRAWASELARMADDAGLQQRWRNNSWGVPYGNVHGQVDASIVELRRRAAKLDKDRLALLPHPAAPLPVAAKVALGLGGTAAVAAGGVGVYALATGIGYTAALDVAWTAIKRGAMGSYRWATGAAEPKKRRRLRA